MTLDNRLERLLMQALAASGPDGAGIEPGLADTIAQQAQRRRSSRRRWA
jgi:flagellar biosynthesis protein FlhA